MKKQFPLVLFAAFSAFKLSAQKETFDIATFTPPPGWQRLDTNRVLAFHDSRTTNGLTSFCQIVLFPSLASNNTPAKNFQEEWDNRVVKTTGDKTKPTTQSEKKPDGWTLVTGAANLSAKGITYACVLVTMSGFGKVMSVMVNMAGSEYTSTVDKFFDELNLDNKAMVVNPSNINPVAMLNDYEFIPPQGWQAQNKKEYIQFQNMGSGCLIQVFIPQPSTGNLEQDAVAVFEMMYKGWQFQRTGERQFDLSKGFLPKGLEYCRMEASMSMTGTDVRYHLEEGIAFLVKAGNQNVIISVRHNASMMEHDDCWKKYETCGRFFNSFTVKNVPIPGSGAVDNSKRIIGVWGVTGPGVVAGEYVFAANGHCQLGGAIGSSTTTTDYRYEYLHLTSYAFEGDGTYSIAGNQLTLKKRGDNPEQARIRFEQVNHGGKGWKDRFYILKTRTVDGKEKEYEACYEKSEPK